MKITALVENQSDCELNAVHGLSLFIETPKHKLLFDVGPDNTIFENCRILGVDLSEIDTVVLSHGHKDHGGALEQFLKINRNAKVFAQRKAFERFYSKTHIAEESIGIPEHLREHPQVIPLDGDFTIDDELILFTTPNTDKFRSSENDTLYNERGKDDFAHENCLLVLGNTNVLIMGCGHAGVVNILEKATPYNPQICVGGYHLQNPVTKKTVSAELLDGIAQELAKYDIEYYTCHCTGQTAYDYLKEKLPDMHYLSCGKTIEKKD